MSQRFTRMLSLNRDNIMQMTAQPDFFTRNPNLLDLKPALDDCRAAFNASAQAAGCACRADTTLLAPCVSAFLQTLDEKKQTDPETVQQFVQYVAKTPDIKSTGVTIFYAKPGDTAPTRYVFP